MSIKARIKLHHFSDYFKLVQGALEVEEIERDFSTRSQERSKRGGFHFSSPKTWFQKFGEHIFSNKTFKQISCRELC